MAWPKGKPRPPGAGRKAGTPNKRTLEVERIIEEENADPIRYMARVCSGIEEPNVARFMAAKELAQYVAPKRKAVEHSGNIDSEVQWTTLSGASIAKSAAKFVGKDGQRANQEDSGDQAGGAKDVSIGSSDDSGESD